MIQNIEGTTIKVKIEDEQFGLPQEIRTKIEIWLAETELSPETEPNFKNV